MRSGPLSLLRHSDSAKAEKSATPARIEKSARGVLHGVSRDSRIAECVPGELPRTGSLCLSPRVPLTD